MEGIKDAFIYRLNGKEAKKLLMAMRKGTWNKLTPAELSQIEDLIVALESDVE